MIFRGGLNDLSIPLSISSTLRRHNFFCIDAIIYSHNIRSRVDAPASTQGRIDASLPKLHRTFHLELSLLDVQSVVKIQVASGGVITSDAGRRFEVLFRDVIALHLVGVRTD